MTAVLSEITQGFADPVHGAQQTFRCVLDAMSRPGRIFKLPLSSLDGLEPLPAKAGARSMDMATTAVLLALLDGETSIRLHGSLASDAALLGLQFHTGVRGAMPGEAGAFEAWRASEMPPRVWSALERGSDEVPQRGATLIVEVAGLGEAVAGAEPLLSLTGPGIESTRALAVAGVPASFWRERIALEPMFPRGIDLLLVHGTRVAALPRSTRISLEA